MSIDILILVCATSDESNYWPLLPFYGWLPCPPNSEEREIPLHQDDWADWS